MCFIWMGHWTQEKPPSLGSQASRVISKIIKLTIKASKGEKLVLVRHGAVYNTHAQGENPQVTCFSSTLPLIHPPPSNLPWRRLCCVFPGLNKRPGPQQLTVVFLISKLCCSPAWNFPSFPHLFSFSNVLRELLLILTPLCTAGLQMVAFWVICIRVLCTHCLNIIRLVIK